MKRRTFLLWTLPSLFFIIAVVGYPILYSIWISFLDYDIHTLTGGFVGLKNYLDALSREEFKESLITTILYFGIPSLSIQISLGFFIALLLNRKIKGRWVFLTLLLMPFMIPPVTAGLVMKWMFNPSWGIVNYFLSFFGLGGINWLGDPLFARIAVILANVWQYSPLIALIFFAGLQSLPRAPIEAAMMDGASYWETVRYVIFPLMKPFILFVLIIRSMDCLRIFDQVMIMTKGGPGFATEMFSIYNYRIGFRYFNLGEAAALSLLYLLLLLGLIVGYVYFLYKKERGEL